MKDGGYIYSYSDIRYDGSLQMDPGTKSGPAGPLMLCNSALDDQGDGRNNYIVSNLGLFNQNLGGSEAQNTVIGGGKENIINGTQSQTIASQFSVTGIDDIKIPIACGIFDYVADDGLTINVWFSLNNTKSNFAQFTIYRKKLPHEYLSNKYVGNQTMLNADPRDRIYMIPLKYLYTNQTYSPPAEKESDISYAELKKAYGKSRGMSLSFTLEVTSVRAKIYYLDIEYGNGLSLQDVSSYTYSSYWNKYTDGMAAAINKRITSKQNIQNLINDDDDTVGSLAKSINSALKDLVQVGGAGHFASTSPAISRATWDATSDFQGVDLQDAASFYTMFTVTYIDMSAQVSYNGLSKPVGALGSSPSCRSTEDYFTFPCYFGSTGQAYNITDTTRNIIDIDTPDPVGDIPIPEPPNALSRPPRPTYSLYLSGTLDADKLQRTCPKVLQAPSLPALTKNTWSTNSNVVKTLVPNVYDNIALNDVLKAYNSASIILENVVQYSKKHPDLKYSKFYALMSPIIWTLTAACVYDIWRNQGGGFSAAITGIFPLLDIDGLNPPPPSPSGRRRQFDNTIRRSLEADWPECLQLYNKYI